MAVVQTIIERVAPEAPEWDFEAAVRRHQAMVFGICWNYLGNRGQAEELAQDVFVQLFRSRAGIESEAHLVNWLRRVAVNRAIDAGRKRRPLVALDAVAEPASPANASDPFLTAALRKLVESLPDKKRMLIVLRYQEELDPEEIARLLEMPVGTVKSHLQRTLGLLREKAERLFGERVK